MGYEELYIWSSQHDETASIWAEKLNRMMTEIYGRSESDPTVPSYVKSISQNNISNWNAAYGWGNHANAHYLTSFSENDPTVPSYVKSISQNDISDWNAAHGWGNHASAGYVTGTPWTSMGYLTSFSESDPTVPSYVKSISQNDISDWNAAHGWGNHASFNYIISPSYSSGTRYLQNISGVYSWATISGGSPGGNSGEFQYNNAGSFAGAPIKVISGNPYLSTGYLYGDTGTNESLVLGHSLGTILSYGDVKLILASYARLVGLSGVSISVYANNMEFMDQNGVGLKARLSYKGLSLGSWTAFDALASLDIAANIGIGGAGSTDRIPLHIGIGNLITNPIAGMMETDNSGDLYWTNNAGVRTKIN